MLQCDAMWTSNFKLEFPTNLVSSRLKDFHWKNVQLPVGIPNAFRMHFGCISDKTCQKEMKGENWMELAVVWERCCQIY